jgi:uncharacterized membrane protein
MTPKNITLDSSRKISPSCILLLTIGLLLLIIYIIDSFTQIIGINSSTLGTILAFSIILIGVGLILFFFSCLFHKLATIADEIEQECNEVEK